MGGESWGHRAWQADSEEAVDPLGCGYGGWKSCRRQEERTGVLGWKVAPGGLRVQCLRGLGMIRPGV